MFNEYVKNKRNRKSTGEQLPHTFEKKKNNKFDEHTKHEITRNHFEKLSDETLGVYWDSRTRAIIYVRSFSRLNRKKEANRMTTCSSGSKYIWSKSCRETEQHSYMFFFKHQYNL